ncbi:MAG: undecaprenyldiphospho-muramoylpentapeptide beta-N-acetylglucosaminyltransferase [Marinilabiliaceae bacterium]|nr:undecaprenyldiphospho-muramoylpentapeptide beta-N-acetylglucosaminyltransferase [Marinilabiliaceae bacterium]
MRVIISGGGTGGHIFPAISIANALKEADSTTEILFVGAKGKMEMEKVPAAGYKIEGLPVAGFHRQINIRNIGRNMLFPFKLVASMFKAWSIVRSFKPDVAVGVGGYASGPVLRCAASAGVPCLIQEQNSYPGVTNKILAQKAKKICVAYPNMERFFSAEKIIMTGNPVRQQLLNSTTREEAAKEFGLDASKPVILVIGGSLGARSINNGISETLDILDDNVQLLWQTGKIYFEGVSNLLAKKKRENVKAMDFIKRMDLAFSIADVVVSRAGASSISELALLGKPSILVPSPNVSEDHQTKNAMALSNVGAAVLVKDADTKQLIEVAMRCLSNKEKLKELSDNIRSFAKPTAASDIAVEVRKLVVEKN